MTTIYVIRHAEAEGNVYRRIHGWYNSLITDNGYRQMEALEERFREVHVDAVYSSDLYRTMTTARTVYVPHGLPLRTDPGLREMNLGDWEDITFGEARSRWPEELDRFNRNDPTWRAPNGENFFQLGERVEEAVRRIAKNHPDQTIALFSHGMAIRQLLAQVKGLPPEDWHTVSHGDNTAVTRLTLEGERLCAAGPELDSSHLSPEISTLARQAWWRKGGKATDVNLRYRPLDWETERELYLEIRRGAESRPSEAALLAEAERCLAQTPWGVTLALAGDQAVGLLLLDPARDRGEGAGFIPFLSILPQSRGKGLGIQLIGQAVAFYRPQGRDRLHIVPGAEGAADYLRKYGFSGSGLMEKYIGFDR